MIKNNNIQGTSPSGKQYYLTFYHLIEFIKSQRWKTKIEEFDLRNSLIPRIFLGFESPILIHKKEKILVKSIIQGEPIEEDRKLELYNNLTSGKEVNINNWKFKVI